MLPQRFALLKIFATEPKNFYRAVDKHGQTIDFLLTATRDARTAKRFLRKVLAGPVH